MSEFITGTILGVAGGIVGAYIFYKLIIYPKLFNIALAVERQRIVLAGLFKDGSVMLAFQSVFAQRLEEIEEKLDIDSMTPEDYKEIQTEILEGIDSHIESLATSE